MTLPIISNYIDDRNRELWNSLNKEFSITLCYSSDQVFGCYSQNKAAIVFVPQGDYCKDSFTHELLHIYLKTKGIYIGNHLALRFWGDSLLSTVYSDKLIEHVGNCLDHVKMLPIYLKLGFDRAKFISDYDSPKCTTNDIDLLKAALNHNFYRWREAADYYLGKFFGIKSCPNISLDYSSMLKQLLLIDPVLYNTLNNFWNSCIQFDIDNTDPIFNSYYAFCDTLIDGLKDWTIQMTQ